MWFIGVEVEQETSAPPPKKILHPPLKGKRNGQTCSVQSSTDRTAVPFSPRQSTTKVALLKATKHKANPATDEVREENRNHGLA